MEGEVEVLWSIFQRGYRFGMLTKSKCSRMDGKQIFAAKNSGSWPLKVFLLWLILPVEFSFVPKIFLCCIHTTGTYLAFL